LRVGIYDDGALDVVCDDGVVVVEAASSTCRHQPPDEIGDTSTQVGANSIGFEKLSGILRRIYGRNSY